MSDENYTCKADHIWPVGKKAAALTAIVVAGLGMLDLMHRQILASVLPLIKAEWNITDTEAGMLVSIVNIALAVLVIPSAYLVDNWSRKKMLAIMAAIWSVATGLGAIAQNYTQLLVFRFFLGSGEAGYNPVAPPLLASSFPKKWRATAVSITQIGVTFGVPLGTIYGAYAAIAFGWRNAFLIAMIPGLILAFCALFIHDFKTPPKSKNKTSYSAVILEILKTRSFIYTMISATAYFFFCGIQMNWLPSYFVREGGLDLEQASIYSSMVLAMTIIATICTGPVIDFARKFGERTIPIILGCGLFFGTALYQTGLIFAPAGSMQQTILFMIGNFVAGLMCAGVYISVLSVIRPGIQATALSIVIFCQNVLGFALGPLFAGILSDQYGLGAAMQILMFSPAIGGISFIFCTFTFNFDVEKAGCQDYSFEE